jgi:glucan biosynthesis protein
MTQVAEDMGLSKANLVVVVADKLGRAGLHARPTNANGDEEVLLVDVVVEDETFYVSLGFWRVASYPQPQGETDSGFVTVWQDFSVGAHHGDVDTVYQAVTTIIDRFVASYSNANELGDSVQVASTP